MINTDSKTPATLDTGVEVWLCRCEERLEPALYQALGSVLSADERGRAERFRFARDRDQFVVAHALLRISLARRLSVRADEVAFQADRRGKPRLAKTSSLMGVAFNLSHTWGLAACALGSHCHLGIDAEFTSRALDLGVSADILSASEQAQLHQLPQSLRKERLIELWTLKEAYVKARGLGLAIDVTQAMFDIGAGGPLAQFDPRLKDDPSAWQFYLLRLRAFRIAVAARRHDQQVTSLAIQPELTPVALVDALDQAVPTA